MTSRIRKSAGLGLVLLWLAASGCRQLSASKPTGVIVEVGNGSVYLLRWKGGPAVMICSDVKGGTASQGEGWSSTRYKAQASRSAPDGRRCDWELETTDGRSVQCRVNGKDYDLADGTLFLIKTKGGKTVVEQLDQDLSAVEPDEKSCRDFAHKNPAVRKLLGLGAD
jgi:hypothetical protein